MSDKNSNLVRGDNKTAYATLYLQAILDKNLNANISEDELYALDIDKDGFFTPEDVKQILTTAPSSHFLDGGIKTSFLWNCKKTHTEITCREIAAHITKDMTPKTFKMIYSIFSGSEYFATVFDGLPNEYNYNNGKYKYADEFIGNWQVYQVLTSLFMSRSSWTPKLLIDLKNELKSSNGDPRLVSVIEKILAWAEYKKISRLYNAKIDMALGRILGIDSSKEISKRFRSLAAVVESLPGILKSFFKTGKIDFKEREEMLANARNGDSILAGSIEVLLNGINGIKYRNGVTEKDFEVQFDAAGCLITRRLSEIGFLADYKIENSGEKFPKELSIVISWPNTPRLSNHLATTGK